MAPFTVFLIPLLMVMDSGNLDWHINVLCRVSHGFIIDVSRGMLDRLVVNRGDRMLNWLILSFLSVVLVTWWWLVVMRSGIMMVSYVRFSWNHSHMVINMVFIVVTVIDEMNIMVRELMSAMMNWLMMNWMFIMVLNDMHVVMNRVEIMVLNFMMIMVNWMHDLVVVMNDWM